MNRFSLALVFLSAFQAFSQDIHWSQFNDNPVFQNPSNTGDFHGDTRFIGNFRDQWRSVSVPFQTLSLCVDSKAKHFNYGFLMFHDQAGDGKFRTLEAIGTLSKGIALTSDSLHTFSGGLTFGINHRQVNTDAFYFDAQYNGYIFNPLLPTNENFQTDRKTNLTLGLGTQYSFTTNKRNYVKVGLSAFNLTRPNQGFYQDKIRRDLRWVVQVKYCKSLNATWDILPSLQYAKQGAYDEVMLGSSVRYYLPGSSDNYIRKALLAGVWVRAKDAQILSIGCEYKDWFVGLSYDINTSKLVPASRARGGFEIAVRYILYKFKPKRIDHRVCPDYI
jgi:type IX secretion system PorP/SprF family membrane protein